LKSEKFFRRRIRIENFPVRVNHQKRIRQIAQNINERVAAVLKLLCADDRIERKFRHKNQEDLATD